MLAVHGYDPGVIDGFAGRKLEDAIRNYQTRAGLSVDGEVTRRLVNHLSRSTTKFVQGMLDLQGYDAGRIDGYSGSKTKIAIRIYKSQAGLKVDGKITQELADHLVRDTTRSVQRMLAARGYDPGPIDGNLGRMTLDAIGEYQDQADIEVDPRISMDLVYTACGRVHETGAGDAGRARLRRRPDRRRCGPKDGNRDPQVPDPGRVGGGWQILAEPA